MGIVVPNQGVPSLARPEIAGTRTAARKPGHVSPKVTRYTFPSKPKTKDDMVSSVCITASFGSGSHQCH
eukprot:945856-Lingulodinium_polyedra.AAC.1